MNNQKVKRDNTFDYFGPLDRIYSSPDDVDYVTSLDSLLLYGTRSPDMVEKYEKPQPPKRSNYLTSAQRNKFITKAPKLSDDVELKEKYLSEAESLRPLNHEMKSFQGLGKRSADECYAILVYIVWKTNYLKDPFFDLLRDTLQRRARGNSYQGKWMFIHEILELSSSKFALWQYLRNRLRSKRYRNGLLKQGYQLCNSITCLGVIPYPVKHKQFKRGYSDNHSGTNSSVCNIQQEQASLVETVNWNKNFVRIPSEAYGLTCFLYNWVPKPVKEKKFSRDYELYLQSEKYISDQEAKKQNDKIILYTKLFELIIQGYYNGVTRGNVSKEYIERLTRKSVRHVPLHLREQN